MSWDNDVLPSPMSRQGCLRDDSELYMCAPKAFRTVNAVNNVIERMQEVLQMPRAESDLVHWLL